MMETLAILPLIISSLTSQPVEADLVALNTQTDVQLVVPFTHQVSDLSEESKALISNTACGPASLTMAFDYLGSELTLESVIAGLPPTVYIKGDKFYDLKSGASPFGFESVDIEQSPTAIYTALSLGNPIVLNIQNYDGILGHALVVTGIRGFDSETGKATSLIVHDPFVGPYREFKYVDANTLMQPEGFVNLIGIINPFYVKIPKV